MLLDFNIYMTEPNETCHVFELTVIDAWSLFVDCEGCRAGIVQGWQWTANDTIRAREAPS